MRKSKTYLIQIRLTDADRRRIKSLAAKQGMTLQDAVIEAFDAWAEKLRTRPPAQGPVAAPQTKPPAPPEFGHLPSLPPEWLKEARQLDWTKCPEVERVSDGEGLYWMLRDSDAPLSGVLRTFADGIPLTEMAEAYEVELLQLAKVLEFALALGKLPIDDRQQTTGNRQPTPDT